MSDHHHFPEELQIEILKRLPVKSLLRFTAVSKSWYFIITSTAFISAHCRHHRNGNSAANLLLLRRYNKSYKVEKCSVLSHTDRQLLSLNNSHELSFPISRVIRYLRTVGFYNGVFCLSEDQCSDPHSVTLWNPSIRKLRTLPCPSIRPACQFRFVLGFGASPRSDDDLKVVRVVYERKGVNLDIGPVIPPLVEIYSLSTGVWRRITAPGVNYYIVDYIWPQAFVNGAVHWIGYKLLEDKSFQSLIAVFTMTDELFDEIMLPDELLSVDPSNLSVIVYEEFVAVVKYSRRIQGDSCELWIMKEYGVVDSWTKLPTIELVGGMKKLVGFRENGELLLSTKKSGLVSYCPDTRVVNDLGILGNNRSFYVHKYLGEFLVLLREQIPL
ncbi:PREDICTED: F-box/kelch-repeat protein At3g23880-like [Ipomoea nil]|uniref:F-box/kelch-repeat protein At3g23880-like n=1 Tax=Ipomoea nil TaxID=35883 RepID=UPI000900A920|nr:PREDICTED: F-box/kelch-repeat protein At3g23880-like [Ipomoea nil]XP_019159143.1 PREDICTED: F-box/kelch-repeat protein At3g23880-like [Ipomoea nil]XP_019159144.1 PREDICTED: F-box/kelch-repeat protein At3g23880-like [Ipomoea nil]